MKPEELQALKLHLAPSTLQLNATELTKIFGWKSRWHIEALKRAANVAGDNPFRSGHATIDSIKAWLNAHPEFVASHWLGSSKRPPPASDPSSPAADTPGGSSRSRAPQTPWPARSARPPAPSA